MAISTVRLARLQQLAGMGAGAALALGATELCTLNTRQGKLAQLAGLHGQP